MKHLLSKTGVLAAFLLAAGIARAELPPTAYSALQAEAKEVLQIRVEQVSSKPASLLNWSTRNERVLATVEKVNRTKSGVKKGDRITVIYSRLIPKGGWAGPSPAPQLERGKEYPAYLEKSADGTFSLAAKGKSFEVVKIR